MRLNHDNLSSYGLNVLFNALLPAAAALKVNIVDIPRGCQQRAWCEEVILECEEHRSAAPLVDHILPNGAAQHGASAACARRGAQRRVLRAGSEKKRWVVVVRARSITLPQASPRCRSAVWPTAVHVH